MRLFHLGCDATMVGDMSSPPVGLGDLFVVLDGPGHLATMAALMAVARRDGAQTLLLTASPEGPSVAQADHVIAIPAQTMANDQDPDQRSVLPMGSLFGGAMFLFFELLILRLRDRLNVDPDDMRARHTNMEKPI